MDLPDSVVISEEGPREGFQIEPGPIATADKIALIGVLSACGLRCFQNWSSGFAKLPLAEILGRYEAARVAYSRVGRPDELSIDPHLLANGGLLATAVSGTGGGPLVGISALPIEFGGGRERPGLGRQPPRVGEHANEILRAAGYSEPDIADLHAAGVLAAAVSVPA